MKERHKKEYEAYWVCRDYDKVREGKISSLPSQRMVAEEKEKTIKILMQYLVEDILNITPEEAVSIITQDFMVKNKLSTFKKNLHHLIPVEYQNDENYSLHLLYHAYPHLPRPNLEERAVEYYKKVLSGKTKSFPDDFFWDKDGDKRVRYCLEYLRTEELQMSQEEWERLFLKNPEEVRKILKKYKLLILLDIFYPSERFLYHLVYKNIF